MVAQVLGGEGEESSLPVTHFPFVDLLPLVLLIQRERLEKPLLPEDQCPLSRVTANPRLRDMGGGALISKCSGGLTPPLLERWLGPLTLLSCW